MKTYWGISALGHDAAISVIRGQEILFAAHSERYSRLKNDAFLNEKIIADAYSYGHPDEIVWFEKPISKRLRQAYAGQWGELNQPTPKKYLKSHLLSVPIRYVSHHESHAAAGFYTSGFDDAAILVVDAIGEWDTISLWHGKNNQLTKIKSTIYPNSVGLLYSAMTQRVGLKPNEEEYILMGMAAYGNPVHYGAIKTDFIEDMSIDNTRLRHNVHNGICWWRSDLQSEQDHMDIAASIQLIIEKFMTDAVRKVKEIVDSRNLIIMGGVALNCVANEKMARLGLFENIWIMPNPGDAGSSIGAVAAYTKTHLNWTTPYLGYNISRPIDKLEVVDSIIKNKIIGIANGRAEFGPRALGNRSLIADPRGQEIKLKVNDIKKRQRFRPFAPVILEHLAHKYFDLPVKSSPYMQFTAKCKYPKKFPAICHVDGSSRVQTLSRDQNPIFYDILEEFYNQTGCPMLLNTSLNIKGEPLVNTWEDAMRFQEKYNVPIF